jgi:hypothetical protein
MTTQFEDLLQRLVSGGVRFILVGGAAGIAHGRSSPDADLEEQRLPDTQS